MQELYAGEPYKLLIGCILCNQSRGRMALTVMHDLFLKYPSIEDIVESELTKLTEILRPLGLQNRRAMTLVKFAKAWIGASESDYLEDLPGVGKYASDSFRLFIHHDWSIVPEDKELKAYMKSKR